jgi:hypothetical protein
MKKGNTKVYDLIVLYYLVNSTSKNSTTDIKIAGNDDAR